MELQELVARARLLFSGAPKRFVVFNLVNGKKSAKEIARKSGKSLSATLQDLQKMRELELITPKKNKARLTLRKDNSIVYEKTPLLKHLPNSYFLDPTKLPVSQKRKMYKRIKQGIRAITIPIEQEILDVCRAGEDQIYEFKEPGIKMDILSKEICAFANTKMGGFVFYGVRDDGTITNSNIKKQTFDQSLQNSIRNTIAPSLSVKIIEKDILGYKILIIAIPPWNRKDVYHFKGKVCIRHGTNVFEAKPEESKKLHAGKYII